jgi:hypothetical protein
MTERLRQMTARILILGSDALILRRRFSDDGATPPDDGTISQMTERLRQMTARFLILGNAAAISETAPSPCGKAPPSQKRLPHPGERRREPVFEAGSLLFAPRRLRLAVLRRGHRETRSRAIFLR